MNKAKVVVATVVATTTVGIGVTSQNVSADEVNNSMTTSNTTNSVTKVQAEANVEQTKETLTNAQKKSDEAQENLDSTQHTQNDAQKDVDDAQAEATKVVNDVNNKTQQVDNAQEQVSNAQQDVNTANAGVIAAKTDAQDSTVENINKAQDDLENAQQNEKTKQDEADKASSEVSNAQQNVENSQTAQETAQEQVNQASSEVSDAQQNEKTKQDEADKAQSDVQQANNDYQSAQNQVNKDADDVSQAQQEADEAKKADEARQTNIDEAQNKVNTDSSELDKKQQNLTDAQEKQGTAQQSVDDNQTVVNDIQDKINNHNTITIPSGYTAQLLATGSVTEIQAIAEAGINLNQYKSNKADEAVTIDITNLSTAQQKEITMFLVDLVNQVRAQMGTTLVSSNQSTADFANTVVANYVNDGWKDKAGHDETALSEAKDQYGVTNVRENIGYDNSSDLTTMDALKKSVYYQTIAMLFADSYMNWGHAQNLTNTGYYEVKPEGYTDYLGLSVRSDSTDGIVAIHYEYAQDTTDFGQVTVTPSTPIDYSSKFDQEDLEGELETAKGVLSASVDVLNSDLKATASAQSEVDIAQQSLNSSKEVLGQMMAVPVQTPNAVEKLTEAQKRLATDQDTEKNAKSNLERTISVNSTKQDELTSSKNDLSLAIKNLADREDELNKATALEQTLQLKLNDARDALSSANATLIDAQKYVSQAQKYLDKLKMAPLVLEEAEKGLAEKEETLGKAQENLEKAQSELQVALNQQKLANANLSEKQNLLSLKILATKASQKLYDSAKQEEQLAQQNYEIANEKLNEINTNEKLAKIVDEQLAQQKQEEEREKSERETAKVQGLHVVGNKIVDENGRAIVGYLVRSGKIIGKNGEEIQNISVNRKTGAIEKLSGEQLTSSDFFDFLTRSQTSPKFKDIVASSVLPQTGEDNGGIGLAVIGALLLSSLGLTKLKKQRKH